MAENTVKPKTLAEVSKVLIGRADEKWLETIIRGYDLTERNKKALDDIIKSLEKIVKSEKARLGILKDIKRFSDEINGKNSKLSKEMDDQIKQLEKVSGAYKGIKVQIDTWDKALSKIVNQNKEIFRIAHDIQLEANMTWKEYTKLYDETYKATRRMRDDIGQSLFVAKDLIETQNKLLGTGWRDIDPTTLTNLSTQFALIQRTLGVLPVELTNALQLSFRQYGEDTSYFVSEIGNRLNTFSRTFGTSIGMLSNVVSSMMSSNTFIARNNMQAQLQANENLMRAASLAGMMGLTETSFLTNLAGTAQFGTMEEMAPLYQTGALMKGFDTGSFQKMMISGEYDKAASMLFSSIGQTIGGISDHYLRAEYMKQIGGTFGLSREDLLNITNNLSNFEEYSEALQGKLKKIDNSMLSELGDLKVNLIDRIENFWLASNASQAVGSILQETGLYGMHDPLKMISNDVRFIASILGAKSAVGLFGKLTGGAVSAAGGTAAGGGASLLSGLAARGGLALGATGLGIAGNVLGSSLQTNTNISAGFANTLGAITNVLSGAASGALTGAVLGGGVPGAVVGGILGTAAGVYNTYKGAQERSSLLQEMEDQKRAERRAAQTVQTGDPIVDAINNMNSNLTNVLNGNFTESRNFSFMLKTYNDTTTAGEPI